jgi:hypothetical protein
MNLDKVSEYNREQWNSFQTIRQAVDTLPESVKEALRESLRPYLQFRHELDAFQEEYFIPICRPACFDTRLSACCGFESIFTFFADEVVTLLLSNPDDLSPLFDVLQRPNKTANCVYLGETGCLWKVRPISCAMFFCDEAKKTLFERSPEAEQRWLAFQDREKGFTRPTQKILFDDLEAFFLELKVDSPHMYFHKSPGLLRLKAKSGVCGTTRVKPSR